MSEPVVVGLEPEPLHALAYSSIPTEPFSDRALSDLLLSARSWNAQYGVTGKLVVLERDGDVVQFAQWVEGPRSHLRACVERIMGDPRHAAFDVRFEGAIAARRFPGWDMAFHPADDAAFAGEAKALVGSDAPASERPPE